jgi:anti-anti-sigma factor
MARDPSFVMDWMRMMFRQDEQGVVHFEGEFSIHELERLRSFLSELLQSGQDLAVSLAAVTFVDAAALQLLVAFRISLPAGRAWRVAAISKKMEQILALSGLSSVLLGQGR